MKGVIHWVNASTALAIEVKLYDRLFTIEDLNHSDEDFRKYLNPDSLKTVKAVAEPCLSEANSKDSFQFMRTGYFCLDDRIAKLR